MGSRLARYLALATLITAPWPALAPIAKAEALFKTECREHDICMAYLNIISRQGRADVSVDHQCLAVFEHQWHLPDARSTIEYWLEPEAAEAYGGVCIQIDGPLSNITFTPLGGHCGYNFGTANSPARQPVILRRGVVSERLEGCQAKLSGLRFGGIAFRFADTYGYGDTFTEGHFYGFYDGFGSEVVAPTDRSVFEIAEHNTYHYQVEIFTGAGTLWRPEKEPEQ